MADTVMPIAQGNLEVLDFPRARQDTTATVSRNGFTPAQRFFLS